MIDKNIKFYIITLNGDRMILREKSGVTEILILLEILKGKKKLKDIANSVGITIQGVSEYLKTLEKEGYIENGKVTISGLEFLTRAIDEIGEFVQDANSIIRKTRITEAIAGENIKKNEEVGLFMENGYLHAYRKSSSSMGTAVISGKKDMDIGVGNLRGVINIKYGEIEVYAMPSIEDGGSRKVDMRKVKKIIKNGKKIGVCGIVAYAVIRKIAKIDFEFSAVNAAIDAYYRGISTQLFVSHEMLPHVLNVLSNRRVKYRLNSI